MSQRVVKNASIIAYKTDTYIQQGFTLVELMISLVLGLLICAAVIQIYSINVRTSTVQRSGSELQEASIFGIQILESHIRLANLGNTITQITDTTPKGGIVLSGANIGLPNYDKPAYLSHSLGDPTGIGTNGWTGISNMNVGSDQLTIQFTNITDTTIADCEGNDIKTGEMVIERYFLRPATSDTSTGAIKNLVLACDAGRLALDSNGQIIGIQVFPSKTDQQNFGQAGQEFITNVDQFNVLLGTQSLIEETAGLLSYFPINAYTSATDIKPAIITLKLGLVVHGSTPIIGTSDSGDKPYVVLGISQTLKNDSTRKQQIHTTYESSILLRNARVTDLAKS